MDEAVRLANDLLNARSTKFKAGCRFLGRHTSVLKTLVEIFRGKNDRFRYNLKGRTTNVD